MESIGDIATVTVHIKKIREKIELNTAKPQYIETIWGVGYRFKVWENILDKYARISYSKVVKTRGAYLIGWEEVKNFDPYTWFG